MKGSVNSQPALLALLIHRLVHPLVAGGMTCEAVAANPVLFRADRAHSKPAAAVGAYIVQYALRAICTKSALVRADAGVRRIGWQVAITMFATGSQFQHGASGAALTGA